MCPEQQSTATKKTNYHKKKESQSQPIVAYVSVHAPLECERKCVCVGAIRRVNFGFVKIIYTNRWDRVLTYTLQLYCTVGHLRYIYELLGIVSVPPLAAFYFVQIDRMHVWSVRCVCSSFVYFSAFTFLVCSLFLCLFGSSLSLSLRSRRLYEVCIHTRDTQMNEVDMWKPKKFRRSHYGRVVVCPLSIYATPYVCIWSAFVFVDNRRRKTESSYLHCVVCVFHFGSIVSLSLYLTISVCV